MAHLKREEACVAPKVHKSITDHNKIPVDHLDYGYISKCSDVKELERIIKILRSGKEGSYPHLTAYAEDELRKLAPDARVLHVEEPVLTKADMDAKVWNDQCSDMMSWSDKMRSHQAAFDSSKSPEKLKHPPIRSCTRENGIRNMAGLNAACEATTKSKRISSCDYSSWEKYDAETEVMKMDVEEERQKVERERVKKAAKKADTKEERIIEILEASVGFTEPERKQYAEELRRQGNEYFNTKDIAMAVESYTASIRLLPTALSYCNRAATYLKMCKFSAALADCTEAIQLDPQCYKAYYRRAIAYQHQNKFNEALADVETVILSGNKSLLVQHLADTLREQCASLPRTLRYMVKEKDSESGEEKTVLEEVLESEVHTKRNHLKNAVQVNEWGLPTQPWTNYNRPFRIVKHSGDTIVNNDIAASVMKPRTGGVKIVELKDEPYEMSEEKMDRPKRLEIVEFERSEEKKAKLSDKEKQDKPKRKILGARESSPKRCVITDRRSGDSDLIPPASTTKVVIPVAPKYATSRKASSGMTSSTVGAHGDNPCSNKTQESEDHLKSVVVKYADARKTSSGIHSPNVGVRGDDPCSNKTQELEDRFKAHVHLQARCSSKGVDEDNNTATSSVTPYQFTQLFTKACDKQADLSEHAIVLRATPPSTLHNVVTNKLDEQMLEMLIRCLRCHFDSQSESQLIADYLIAITDLDRYSIISSFLSKEVQNDFWDLANQLPPFDSAKLSKCWKR